jgi:hypothetical protein
MNYSKQKLFYVIGGIIIILVAILLIQNIFFKKVERKDNNVRIYTDEEKRAIMDQVNPDATPSPAYSDKEKQKLIPTGAKVASSTSISEQEKSNIMNGN